MRNLTPTTYLNFLYDIARIVYRARFLNPTPEQISACLREVSALGETSLPSEDPVRVSLEFPSGRMLEQHRLTALSVADPIDLSSPSRLLDAPTAALAAWCRNCRTRFARRKHLARDPDARHARSPTLGDLASSVRRRARHHRHLAVQNCAHGSQSAVGRARRVMPTRLCRRQLHREEESRSDPPSGPGCARRLAESRRCVKSYPDVFAGDRADESNSRPPARRLPCRR